MTPNLVKPIAIIYPEWKLDSVPTLLSLIEGLVQRGLEVHLFCIFRDGFTLFRPIFHQIHLHNIGKYDGVGLLARFTELRKWRHTIGLHAPLGGFGCIIGIDQLGLILSSQLSRKTGGEVYYFSLELLFWNELTRPSLFLLKAAECFCMKRVRGIIIQDQTRADALRSSCWQNQIKVFELPNAWSGGVFTERTNYLRECHQLSSANTILLMAGSCSPFTMPLEVAQSARDWNHSLTLIIQVRESLINSAYQNDVIKEERAGRLLINTTPYPSTEFHRMVASSDIGVVFYSRQNTPSLGCNIAICGKSSGKLSTFLQCRVPVIVNACGGLAGLVQEYNCGIVVESVAEIEQAACQIMNDYATYARNAERCFQEEFASDQFLPAILSCIEEHNGKSGE